MLDKKLRRLFASDVIVKIAFNICSRSRGNGNGKTMSRFLETLSSVFTQCKHVILTTRAFWLISKILIRLLPRSVVQDAGKLNWRGFSSHLRIFSRFSFFNSTQHTDLFSHLNGTEDSD